MLRTAHRVPAYIVCALAATVALPRAARANGAFPDGQTVILRGDRPREIVVATNFGLVVSEDDGASWRYSCEEDREARNTYRFDGDRGPPHRIFAMGQRQGGNYGLVVTRDEGCSWEPAMATMDYLEVRDYFLEPGPAGRILALAAYQAEAGLLGGLFLSADGGKTFGAPLRGAPPGVSFASVESARSDPQVIYLVAEEGRRHRLERSSDAGRTWRAHELADAWGEQFFIITVDPDDSERVLVRAISYVGGFAVDRLLSSRDGGATWKVVVDLSADGGGALSAFLRRADGSLVVAGQKHLAGAPAVAFVSRDRGDSWAPWDGGGLHVRGLGERNGQVYAVTNELADGFALARGPGDGAPWEPLLRYGQIAGIRPCAQVRCRASCLTLATAYALFPRSSCDPPGVTRPDGSGSSNAPDGGVEGGTGGGCGCAVGGAGTGGAMVVVGGIGWGISWARRRRRRAEVSARSAP